MADDFWKMKHVYAQMNRQGAADSKTTHAVAKKDPAVIRADFPIADLVEGWFFRQREMSVGAYLVEGTDLWGRMVSRSGDDVDALLVACAEDARRIQSKIGNDR
jgi:hypothetical protein